MIFASPHRAGWIKIQQRPSPAVLFVQPSYFPSLAVIRRQFTEFFLSEEKCWIGCGKKRKERVEKNATKISRHDRLMTERPKWLPYKKDRLPYNLRLYNRQESVLRGHRIFRDNLLAYKLHSKAAYCTRTGLRVFSCRWRMPGKKLSAFAAFRKAFTAHHANSSQKRWLSYQMM